MTIAKTTTVKAGLKATTTVFSKTIESATRVITNQKRDELKKNTNKDN